jgi:hypothetical protein
MNIADIKQAQKTVEKLDEFFEKKLKEAGWEGSISNIKWGIWREDADSILFKIHFDTFIYGCSDPDTACLTIAHAELAALRTEK